jgi:hypothetical protein
MASPAAVLSILVSADTRQATSALTKYDEQLEKSNEIAKKGIEARLGASFDPAAFDAYNQKTSQIARRTADKSAFKAELGANFSNAGFNAYEREVNRTGRSSDDLEEKSGGLRSRLSETADAAGKAGGMFSGLAGGMLGAVGAFGAYSAAKDAISSTLQLGEATERLSAITGADTKTASTWIGVMQSRGLSTKSASMAFITLEKNIRNAGLGSKTAVEAFQQLGITQAQLRHTDPTQMLGLIANGLQQIRDPAQRAALAQQLFSRGAQAMIPVLAQGSKGVQDALHSAQEYGDYLPNSSKATMGAVEAGRQLNFAMNGLKIAFTSAALPAIVSVAKGILNFIKQMRDGKGAGGAFAAALSAVWKTVQQVVKWVGQMITLFKQGNPLVVAAVGAFAGLLVAVKVLIPVIGLFNAVLDADPFVLIAAAIVALIGALALLYVKVKVVHDFINTAWKDIRNVAMAVWPAIQTIITNVWTFVANYARIVWDGLKNYLGGIFKVIRGIVEVFAGLFTLDFSKMWKGILDIFTGAGQAILGWFETLTAPLRAAAVTAFDVIRDALIDVVNWVIDKLNWLLGKVNDVSSAISSLTGGIVDLGKIGKIGKITIPTAAARVPVGRAFGGHGEAPVTRTAAPAAQHAAGRDAARTFAASTQHVIQWATAAAKTSKSLSSAEKAAERVAKIEEQTAKNKQKAAEQTAKTEAKGAERVAKLHLEAVKAAEKAAAKAGAPLTAAEKRRVIPSLAVGQQVRMAKLQEQAASAKAAGNVGAESSAIQAEIALEKQWLAADQAKLQKVNQQLAKPGLSHSARAQLLQDKLALLQEMAAIQAKIGTGGTNLSSLAKAGTASSSTSTTGATGFDVTPAGGAVTLPTFLDVAKSVQAAPGQHVTHNNQRHTINIHVHNPADVHKVADVIDKATGSHVHAKLRAAGLRGT